MLHSPDTNVQDRDHPQEKQKKAGVHESKSEKIRKESKQRKASDSGLLDDDAISHPLKRQRSEQQTFLLKIMAMQDGEMGELTLTSNPTTKVTLAWVAEQLTTYMAKTTYNLNHPFVFYRGDGATVVLDQGQLDLMVNDYLKIAEPENPMRLMIFVDNESCYSLVTRVNAAHLARVRHERVLAALDERPATSTIGNGNGYLDKVSHSAPRDGGSADNEMKDVRIAEGRDVDNDMSMNDTDHPRVDQLNQLAQVRSSSQQVAASTSTHRKAQISVVDLTAAKTTDAAQSRVKAGTGKDSVNQAAELNTPGLGVSADNPITIGSESNSPAPVVTGPGPATADTTSIVCAPATTLPDAGATASDAHGWNDSADNADNGQQVNAFDMTISQTRDGLHDTSMIQMLFPDIDMSNPQARLPVPSFMTDKLPYAFQGHAALDGLRKEKRMRVEIKDKDGKIIHVQTIGSMDGSEPGTGKTLTLTLKHVFNLCFLTNKLRIRQNRTAHRERGEEGDCPSGRFLKTLRCCCEKKHPFHDYIPSYGALVFPTYAGLVQQTVDAFRSYIHGPTFRQVFKIAFRVRLAHTSLTFNDANRLDADGGEEEEYFCDPSWQEWSEANPNLDKAAFMDLAENAPDRIVAPSMKSLLRSKRPEGLFIVMAYDGTKNCILTRGFETPAFGILSQYDHTSGFALTAQAIIRLDCEPTNADLCWKEGCTGGEMHELVLQTPMLLPRLLVARIAIDECHKYSQPARDRPLGLVIKAQREHARIGPILNPISGTPIVATPFDIAAWIKLQTDDQALKDEIKALAAASVPQFEHIAAFLKAGLDKHTHAEWLTWWKLYEKYQPRSPKLQSATVTAIVKPFAALCLQSVTQVMDFVQQMVPGFLDAVMFRYKDSSKWNGQRLIDIPQVHDEELCVKMADGGKGAIGTVADVLRKKSRRFIDAQKELNRLRDIGAQPRNLRAAEEELRTAQTAVTDGTQRFVDGLSIPALAAYDNEDNKAIFTSNHCKEEGYYQEPAKYPLAAIANKVAASPKIQAMCQQIVRRFWGTRAHSRICDTVAKSVRRRAAVLVVVDHTPVSLPLLIGMKSWFETKYAGHNVNIDYISPDKSPRVRNDIVNRFEGKIESNEKIIDILILPSGLSAEGLNLAFCHIMYFFQVIRKPFQYLQSRGRINRIGQTHEQYFIQVLDRTFETERGLVNDREKKGDLILPLLDLVHEEEVVEGEAVATFGCGNAA